MFHYRQWLILPICALWLVSGVGIAYAQKDGDDKAQAIESVKKNLASDPKNQGLQQALQCLERADQCNDQHQLDQAIGSVPDNLKHHPEDQGMHHALDDLEHQLQELGQHMDSAHPHAKTLRRMAMPRIPLDRRAVTSNSFD